MVYFVNVFLLNIDDQFKCDQMQAVVFLCIVQVFIVLLHQNHDLLSDMLEYIHHQSHLNDIIPIHTCQEYIDLLRSEIHPDIGELLYELLLDMLDLSFTAPVLLFKRFDLLGVFCFGCFDLALHRRGDLLLSVESNSVFIAGNILMQGIDLFFVREKIILYECVYDMVEDFIHIFLNIFFVRADPCGVGCLFELVCILKSLFQFRQQCIPECIHMLLFTLRFVQFDRFQLLVEFDCLVLRSLIEFGSLFEHIGFPVCL